MATIIISRMSVKSGRGGYRHQVAKIKQVDYHGNKLMREFLLPIEPHEEPYAVGVYDLSDRSFYVDRQSQKLQLMPRLRWIRSLKSIQDEADQAGIQYLPAEELAA